MMMMMMSRHNQKSANEEKQEENGDEETGNDAKMFLSFLSRSSVVFFLLFQLVKRLRLLISTFLVLLSFDC